MISINSSIFILSDLSKPTPLAEILKNKDKLPLPIFTVVDDAITVGWLEALAPVGKRPTVKIELDDGSVLVVAREQKIFLLDGDSVRADTLSSGKSLLPLYLSQDHGGYPTYYQIGDKHLKAPVPMDAQRKRKISRMVAEFKLQTALEPQTTVRHIDENRLNCHPDNLKITVDTGKKPRTFMHPYVKAVKDALDFIKEHPRNHKVLAVSEGESESVYGLISRESKSVAVGGIFLNTLEEE